MPSPFPGMDPYLEGSVSESLHVLLAGEIARSLAPRLLPRYIVRPEKIYVMSMSNGQDIVGPPATRRRPDVSVALGDPAATVPGEGNLAVLEVPLQVDLPMPEVEPEPQLSVEIRDPLDQSLVTAIEVLSTSNKRGDGRDQYLVTRDRILLSETHLIEIDLVRTGDRLPMAGKLPDVPCLVVRNRADRCPRADVWPITFKGPASDDPSAASRFRSRGSARSPDHSRHAIRPVRAERGLELPTAPARSPRCRLGHRTVGPSATMTTTLNPLPNRDPTCP